jgi:hypothetical protein
MNSRLNSFETFIKTVREQVPECPHCGRPTSSSFVCKQCRQVHCWYCNYSLREVPKDMFRGALKEMQTPVDLRRPDGKDMTWQDVIDDVKEKSRLISIENICAFVMEVAEDNSYHCPRCHALLERMEINEDGALCCRSCHGFLRYLSAEMWAAAIDKKVRYFRGHGKEVSSE